MPGATGFRGRAVRGQGRLFPGALLSGHRGRAGAGSYRDNQQRILLTLATGTGKTFIAFQIAWKLFHSRWNFQRLENRRRTDPASAHPVLWLTATFWQIRLTTPFPPFPKTRWCGLNQTTSARRASVPKNGSLFFTIFQTFMSGPPKDGQPSPYFGEYPPDFFDFIVIDECHRGGANDESTWRGILDYFAPAVQLGLTATPKRKDNVDTYAYFGEPVFIYSLKDGINDGFLTPFRVKQIATTLDEYVYTPDDTLIEGEIEAGKRYQEADFNRIIEIKEREKKRVEISCRRSISGKNAGFLRHSGSRAGGARPD
jgi:type I restriction enzyme R subunit